MEVYLSDQQIAAQYEGFKITHLSFDEPLHDGQEWFSGTVEIDFPNATHPDFDSAIVDNFISYGREGNRIAFDHWFPETVYYNLCHQIRKTYESKRDLVSC